MNKYLIGIVAGFTGTAVLTLLMAMKMAVGIMPNLNVIHMLTSLAHGMMGTPENLMVGWMLHFMIGSVVWGVLFAAIVGSIHGKAFWQKGILFGIGAWVLMMLGPMPMAGAGLFGLNMGMMAPIMTLMLHVIFGLVLGSTYQKLLLKYEDSAG